MLCIYWYEFYMHIRENLGSLSRAFRYPGWQDILQMLLTVRWSGPNFSWDLTIDWPATIGILWDFLGIYVWGCPIAWGYPGTPWRVTISWKIRSLKLDTSKSSFISMYCDPYNNPLWWYFGHSATSQRCGLAQWLTSTCPTLGYL